MNKLIRCIVVDDEPLPVKLLADYVFKTQGLDLVLKTTHVLEALQYVQDGKADIVFLDIQMPELTGMQFIKIIRGACQVILTTAYSEYAAESYEHDVTDYLLKPVTYERFSIAVQKAKKKLEQEMLQGTTPLPKNDYIFVKTEYRIQKINFSDVLYIEAMRDYIAFHTKAGKVLSLDSMRNMEEVLPAEAFLRIHKSYIINIKNIDFIERGKIVVNNQYLPVGDTYKDAVTAILGL
ncbi:MAG TPA: LytTR family DNA-binding domain-containing protein [Chitinophagaceae bacterium]|nr:LytTR family DNA-binding domain-containing protein [Chitinophagaceae bacterium]